MKNTLKYLVLFILFTLNLVAVESCEYKSSPSSFQNTDNNGQDIYFKLYPNESSGSQRIAYMDIQADGTSFENRGQITTYVNNVRTNISLSKNMTNSSANYKYKVGD